MAITKEKKAEVLKKIEDIVKGAKTVVFANFKGLTVAESNEMRRGLRAQSVGYTVAKKTLIRRALGAAKISGEIPPLEGEIALVYGEDELAPARELAVFSKKFGEHLSLAGGVFGGAFVGGSKMQEIASIPPIDTLRGQFVNIINSPLQRLAVVLNQVAEKRA